MKLSLSTFQLYLLYSTPLAYSLHGQRTPPAVAQDPFVQEVIAGLSYIIKLPCINCPYHPDPQGDWEGPPEPNCLLLSFTLVPLRPGGSPFDLNLNNHSFYPIYYERRTPIYESQPFPFVPPFDAYQVRMNISNQEIKDLYSIQKDGSAWSLRISIENPQLAYHYRYYKALRDEDILLELEISGFRHDDHNPKAIEFRDGVGVPSLVRLLMASDDSQGGRRIRKVQLIPRFQLPETGAVSALEEPSESLAGPDWGGRYNADAGLWTDWTFEPGQWNDCGKTDDRWRQFLCILEDLGMDCVGFIVACVLGGLVIMVILALMCWRLFKISRKSFREKEKRQEERDALLLSGDEDLDELSLKDEEEKAIARALSSNPPIVAEENEDEIDNSGDWRFGPFQQNLGDGV